MFIDFSKVAVVELDLFDTVVVRTFVVVVIVQFFTKIEYTHHSMNRLIDHGAN